MKVYKVVERYQIFTIHDDCYRSEHIIDMERVVAICKTAIAAQEYIDDTLKTLRSNKTITDSEARANVIEWWFEGEEKTWFKQKFVIEEYELIH
jgi:hypothetical protein